MCVCVCVCVCVCGADVACAVLQAEDKTVPFAKYLPRFQRAMGSAMFLAGDRLSFADILLFQVRSPKITVAVFTLILTNSFMQITYRVVGPPPGLAAAARLAPVAAKRRSRSAPCARGARAADCGAPDNGAVPWRQYKALPAPRPSWLHGQGYGDDPVDQEGRACAPSASVRRVALQAEQQAVRTWSDERIGSDAFTKAPRDSRVPDSAPRHPLSPSL